MRPPPPDWPRISTSLYYDEAAKAIDWLCRAFGFELRLKVEGEGGRIEHSELEYGEGLIMVSESKDSMPHSQSPSQVGGGNTQNLMVYVDDVEAHWARAREAGATMVGEIAGAPLAGPEEVDHPTARRVGEGGERAIDLAHERVGGLRRRWAKYQ